MKVTTVKIESLIPDPKNARTHSRRNIDAIKNSLNEFGQQRPLVVTQDRMVVAGNGTLEAAKELGWTEIAVTIFPSSDYDRVRAYALADNRTSELAEWDSEILKDQLIELDAVGWDLGVLGFESLQPPTDPFAEWQGLPEYETDDRLAAFECKIKFRTELDADEFFAMIGRPKKSNFWYPESDGHVGSDVKVQYVAE